MSPLLWHFKILYYVAPPSGKGNKGKVFVQEVMNYEKLLRVVNARDPRPIKGDYSEVRLGTSLLNRIDSPHDSARRLFWQIR